MVAYLCGLASVGLDSSSSGSACFFKFFGFFLRRQLLPHIQVQQQLGGWSHLVSPLNFSFVPIVLCIDSSNPMPI